ncbi:30S ribosomal protein S8 [Paracholeplasma manati]|jgi:small subunit ribosomal protein S8|uniref:Small ribosomal subunit protein uS8 n=1 Tax=Paracholeplasma manati TaxID=591373 RepID=A0ABT2Y4G0_9MOLU|nr:30S ribosomal protein S8 [Paracholeplasma manati]MCV2231619.1 30S ribosomal protein S8 [Paracholeplasma manati]MDG0888638.1 30S ribosomal protein S8 [Paracholeplasma manati]MDX9808062.1 30S ribosomal protein S8 [Acholeplasma sp.]
MVMTDPIADLLTRIRNANSMRHETVEIPASRLKADILNVLKQEGFIVDYVSKNEAVGSTLVVTLKYAANNERVIKGLKRISKPGLRVYAQASQLPKVLNGLGIAIISTSKGILTDREARKQQIGGEVLAYVW